MKDEIKEILSNDNIHIIECDKNWCNAYGYEKSQLKVDLLDYITNLQKELEDLKEDNYAYHQLMKMQNKREYRSKFLKEFQEEFGTNIFPDYDEIYKRYDKLKKENERLNNIVKETRQMLYKRMLDDYDIYTANVVCDFQSDFEEIIRLNGGDEE